MDLIMISLKPVSLCHTADNKAKNINNNDINNEYVSEHPFKGNPITGFLPIPRKVVEESLKVSQFLELTKKNSFGNNNCFVKNLMYRGQAQKISAPKKLD